MENKNLYAWKAAEIKYLKRRVKALQKLAARQAMENYRQYPTARRIIAGLFNTCRRDRGNFLEMFPGHLKPVWRKNLKNIKHWRTPN